MKTRNTAKTFLYQKLEILATEFPEIVFLCTFDKNTDQHIVKVSPTSTYKKDSYGEFEIRLVVDFINHFPDQSLFFISEESELAIPEIEFVITKANPVTTYDTTSTAIMQSISITKKLPYTYTTAFDPNNYIIAKGSMIERTETIIQEPVEFELAPVMAMAA